MKVIYIKKVIDNKEYKIPHIIMSEREKQLFEYQSEKFYKDNFNNLDFRIEPYVIK